MGETRAILVIVKILLNINFIFFHEKNFSVGILFYKKFFNFSQILGQPKKHFEIKFLKFSFQSDNFLLNIIFGQSPDGGVNCVTSVSNLVWGL